MKPVDFNKIVLERMDKCKNTLVRKAQEYATEEDRLHNFYIGANFLDDTPAKYALSLMTKHLVSVRDIVLSKERPSQEIIDEKIGDAINYFILLEAILQEEKTK